MKTGLVKVQRSVDRKMAQVIAGHTQQPPHTAYRAVNHASIRSMSTLEYLRGIAHNFTS